ncbi:MAG: DEDD exonuclease domain-containing protein [Bacteroidota bacterium]|nr:DEDD exonuclease domain-containing protein [Bacteroidota bacterium]
MLLHEASFVVVDVETTGLSAERDRITEIAMVRFEAGAITETFSTLLNPERFIPSEITRITGITNAMVFGKPRFEDALPEIRQFLSRGTANFVFTGHNVKFDHGFVSQSFLRAGDRLELSATDEIEHILCTCRLARRLLPKLKSKSLSSVQGYFGTKNSRQHRAGGDAEATAKVLGHFIAMAEELEIESLEDLIRLQYARPNYGRRKTKRELSLRDKVRAFPERPGVYIMTGSVGEVLYVGKAKNLHDRVSNYFSTANTQGTKLAQLMRVVKDINYEETGSELSALLLESRRIKEHNPRFNSVDRFYKGQAFVRLDVQNPFPTLAMVREPAGDGAEYYGPFKWPSGAEALIDVLNRAFQLRECGDQFRVGAEQRPCLYYEIGRCTAPCALFATEQQYHLEVDRLRAFLAAGDDGILAHVEAMMKLAADRLDFEEAQYYKIRSSELRRILGRGDRPDASLSGNDCVILNPTVPGTCEILLIRFGRLVKQMTFTASQIDIAESWFTRQIRMYYGATSAIPPTAGKPEIDEMRILSRWVEQKREKGTRIIYVEPNWEASVEKLVANLRGLLAPAETHSKPSPARTRKLSLKPMTEPKTKIA